MLSMNDRYRRALYPENGSATISERNADGLLAMIGPPNDVAFVSENNGRKNRVTATWRWPGRKSFEHTFEGFSWRQHSPQSLALSKFVVNVGASKNFTSNDIHYMVSKKEGVAFRITRVGSHWVTAKGPKHPNEG